MYFSYLLFPGKMVQVFPSTSNMKPSLQAHLKVLPTGIQMSPHNWPLNCSQMSSVISTNIEHKFSYIFVSQTFVVVVIIVIQVVVVGGRGCSAGQGSPGRCAKKGLPRPKGAAHAATHIRRVPWRAKQSFVASTAHCHRGHDQPQFTRTAAVLKIAVSHYFTFRLTR